MSPRVRSQATELKAVRLSPDVAANVVTVLQRTGLRPLRIQGRVLRFMEDSAEPTWGRIRLALYYCDDGTYASEIYCMPSARDRPTRAWYQASVSETLSSALTMFELAAPLAESWAGSGSHGTGNVDVLCAVMGVEREAAQLHAFRLAVGRFLFQMCMDPPVICRDNSRTA